MKLSPKHTLIFISIGFLMFQYSCTTSKPASSEKVTVSINKVDENDSTFLEIYNQRQTQYEEDLAFGFATARPELTATEEASKYSLIPVFYATDRKKKNLQKPFKAFVGKKGNEQLELGKCMVSIPKIHALGEIERPLWWKLEFSENIEKHIVLKEVKPLQNTSFFKELRLNADSADRKEALVYIHGFNTSFDEAVMRAAQMVYDISFGGVPIVYSWPSKGKILKYWKDGKNSDWTTPHLEGFLEKLITKGSFERIHIIAHSMGNRPMVEALLALEEKHKGETIFEQVILAAPDIDAEIFVKDIAPHIGQVAKNVTLYASSKDKALQVSKSINKNPRAGQGGDKITVTNGIETVEASTIEMDFVGHDYYATTWILLNDLYQLVNQGLGAEHRELKKQYKSDLIFWSF